jgi:hypothetical protein
MPVPTRIVEEDAEALAVLQSLNTPTNERAVCPEGS